MTNPEIPIFGQIIVIANEKGGCGKSTIAMHIGVGLLKAGHSVTALDLDVRQATLRHYLDNRLTWSDCTGIPLNIPTVATAELYEFPSAEERLASSQALRERIRSLSEKSNFLVIDTPGHNSYLMPVVHEMADILVTPLNDSLLDVEVLGEVDADSCAVRDISHYARMVEEARAERRLSTGKDIDWIVLRNRLSMLSSHNNRAVGESLQVLSRHLNFRLVDGLAERVVFRELFPRGLTAVDDLDTSVLGARPTMSHATARFEIETLLSEIMNTGLGQGRTVDCNAA
jgi:chromosome partitioning protein